MRSGTTRVDSVVIFAAVAVVSALALWAPRSGDAPSQLGDPIDVICDSPITAPSVGLMIHALPRALHPPEDCRGERLAPGRNPGTSGRGQLPRPIGPRVPSFVVLGGGSSSRCHPANCRADSEEVTTQNDKEES